MAKNYSCGGGSYATKVTKKMGTFAEKLFENIIKSWNLEYRSASKKEEMIFHVDYIINNFLNYKLCKIEVKSTKSPGRGKKPDPSILYIELKSVGGYTGWIYGKANYIAFQINNFFILFDRLKLLNYIEKKIIDMPLVKKSGIKGTLYGRRNRKDKVAIFDMYNVMNDLDYIKIVKN